MRWFQLSKKLASSTALIRRCALRFLPRGCGVWAHATIAHSGHFAPALSLSRIGLGLTGGGKIRGRRGRQSEGSPFGACAAAAALVASTAADAGSARYPYATDEGRNMCWRAGWSPFATVSQRKCLVPHGPTHCVRHTYIVCAIRTSVCASTADVVHQQNCSNP